MAGMSSAASSSNRRRTRRKPTLGSRTRRKPRPNQPRSETTAGLQRAKTDTPHLSRREREIVALLIEGRSVKEASAALGLSPRTVEGYLERLKCRFRQPRLLALVVHLVKQGLLVIQLANQGWMEWPSRAS